MAIKNHLFLDLLLDKVNFTCLIMQLVKFLSESLVGCIGVGDNFDCPFQIPL